jgi:hypothetical protein
MLRNHVGIETRGGKQQRVCGEFQFMQQWVSENDPCNEIATNSF